MWFPAEFPSFYEIILPSTTLPAPPPSSPSSQWMCHFEETPFEEKGRKFIESLFFFFFFVVIKMYPAWLFLAARPSSFSWACQRSGNTISSPVCVNFSWVTTSPRTSLLRETKATLRALMEVERRRTEAVSVNTSAVQDCYHGTENMKGWLLYLDIIFTLLRHIYRYFIYLLFSSVRHSWVWERCL